jgi:F0F1-type ATP synthase membrane subunit b/b'
MNEHNSLSESGSDIRVPILIGTVVALLGANIYLYTQLDRVRADFGQFRTSVQNEIAGLKESSTVSTQTARRTLTSLKDELETARRQASMAAGQARIEAQKHAEELAKRLAVEQQRQVAAAQQMKSELTQAVSDVEKNASSKITEVSTEVGQVKTDVASTKSELEKTVSDLKRVRGDLDGTSSIVATNGKELLALRQLGDRNYFEFNLTKSKEPRRIGDVAVVLKKADAKKNKFTIEVIADDKRVEKKDKNTNEPVQFYVSKARQPYEIVVNEVKKNQIVGYLSTPKVQTTRSSN